VAQHFINPLWYNHLWRGKGIELAGSWNAEAIMNKNVYMHVCVFLCSFPPFTTSNVGFVGPGIYTRSSTKELKTRNAQDVHHSKWCFSLQVFLCALGACKFSFIIFILPDLSMIYFIF
jgi:hypothetical protein